MSADHRWRFFRAGGFDQVRLDSAADLLNLRHLDPKLWVALSCPVDGLEFDAATLRYLDSDGDGHLRVPEIIAACEWAGALLKDQDLLARGAPSLPLTAIAEHSEAGRQVLAAARRVLESLDKPDAEALTVADTANIQAVFAKTRFNGDGVVTVASAAEDAASAEAIATLIRLYGGIPDRSGEPGVDAECLARAMSDAAGMQAWQEAGRTAAVLCLGAATADAGTALAAVQAKLDDYFTRCRLAAFDPLAAGALNPSAETYAAAARATLSSQSADLEALPLARIAAGAPLDLRDNLNPAWETRIADFATACVTPMLGAGQRLTDADWQQIKARMAAWQAWRAACPVSPLAGLGAEQVASLLAARPALEALIARDLEYAAEAAGLDSIDRLVRYCRDLGVLVNNFVAFRDFYRKGSPAIFQAGTLYFDGRSCDLVVRVTNPARHAALAGMSRLCLVYCDCVRADGGSERMAIAAAFTAGDADQLIVGRNGVFYDRLGRDWDATITKVIENDISIRQAFWGPYKRAARLIGEQVRKFAATKAAQNEAQLVTKAVEGGAQTVAGKPPPPPFDVAKFAGIFAAIGLAVGAIGTALAAILTGILSLTWWKIPLVFVGVMLAISGPAMLIAWLRLRQRNLGPLLDANGWAINARVLINIPFGAALTQVATLPAGAERSLADPYAERRSRWPLVLALLLAIALAVTTWSLSRGS